jgi:CheY-like chemotaxis protein/two-component sensor histidine kinase
LVSRILTVSKKAESKARPMDLNDAIRRAMKLIRRTIPRMIDIKLALGKDLRIIDADPAQVQQILLNLAVNARQAMPDGGRLLIETSNVSLSDEYLRAHIGAKPGPHVVLIVSDNGVGIQPEFIDRIFEPFFTTKLNGEGTGLGLAMVHGIVSQHGGYIRCYSEPGRGTSFRMYFPVSASEVGLEPTTTRDMPAFGSETILLVDDDHRVRDMANQLIKMGGYRVLTAQSGEQALAVYAREGSDISLVILDLNMPGMGGRRCLEELLRMDPNVKVLVASGYSSNGISQEDKGAGARGFISKPYDAKAILGAIRNVLDRGFF